MTYSKNGRAPIKIRSLHGVFWFNVQKYYDKESKKSKSFFNFTNQFEDGYISERLKEYSSWLSCKLSYKSVEEVLYRHTGEQVLSDQKIQEIVLDTANKISIKDEQEAEKILSEQEMIKLNTDADIYDSQADEIYFFNDGILVKGQKHERVSKNKKQVSELGKKAKLETEVSLLECKNGNYRYITAGLNSSDNPMQTLINQTKKELINEYGDPSKTYTIISITDGARKIKKDLTTIFGNHLIRILDWYHLKEKLKDLMSMIALNKDEKNKHLSYLRKKCWEGEVSKAIDYLKNKVTARNHAKHKELIGYLTKHKVEIINYKKRKEAGKTIGSGRMESGVDQVVGRRQKDNGTSWSKKGTTALAILKVKLLNNDWDKIWELSKKRA